MRRSRCVRDTELAIGRFLPRNQAKRVKTDFRQFRRNPIRVSVRIDTTISLTGRSVSLYELRSSNRGNV